MIMKSGWEQKRIPKLGKKGLVERLLEYGHAEWLEAKKVLKLNKKLLKEYSKSWQKWNTTVNNT